jgi:hypothetical protein
MIVNPPRRAALIPPVGVRTRWDAGSLSPEQAAKFTGMSVTRVRVLMYSGKLTYGREPGTRVNLIPVSSLVAYLDANVEVVEGEY